MEMICRLTGGPAPVTGDTVYSAATGLSAELVEVWGVVALWGEVAGVCLCVCVC